LGKKQRKEWEKGEGGENTKIQRKQNPARKNKKVEGRINGKFTGKRIVGEGQGPDVPELCACKLKRSTSWVGEGGRTTEANKGNNKRALRQNSVYAGFPVAQGSNQRGDQGGGSRWKKRGKERKWTGTH